MLLRRLLATAWLLPLVVFTGCGAAAPVAQASPSTGPIKCGDPTVLSSYPGEESWKGVRVGQLFFSGFDASTGKAVIADFHSGSPTKVVVEPIQPLTAALRLEGWRCANGERLHFDYGPSQDTVAPALLPAGADSNGKPVGYTGYMRFTATDKWMISVATGRGHLIGSAIFLIQ